jgi:hypothetical protein
MTSDSYLRAGEWVEVKSPSEIAKTLDAQGTLDGLPFMPEMLSYCGRRFKVLRRAEKTCFEFEPNRYAVQEFVGNDVVLLDELRCSGSSHDGCSRSCFLFWKQAWLRRADGDDTLRNDHHIEMPLKLRTRSDSGRYVCQATELIRATRPIPRSEKVWKCFRDIRSGSRGLFEMAWLMLLPLWRKATARFPRRSLLGTLRKTPVGDLKLQSGDWVVIKSAKEISKTLDRQGRNRGMNCDLGMCRYSGGAYRVRSRLERMISEPTGEMRNVESTVILEGLHCLCWNTLGGCPRQDFLYWREVWLEKVKSE